MTEHPITNDLCFVESPPRGAILQWVCMEGGEADVFAVSMSWKSLKACRQALKESQISWEIQDGSLKISGTPEKLTLSFRISGSISLRKNLVLKGDALTAFNSVIGNLKKSKRV